MCRISVFSLIFAAFLAASAGAAQQADQPAPAGTIYLDSDVFVDPLEQIARDRDGVPITGVMRNYYPSGRLAWQTEWLDGKLHGVTRGYFESGQLMEETTWVNGKLHGPAKWYDEQGNLRREAMYDNDKETSASAGKGQDADLPGGRE